MDINWTMVVIIIGVGLVFLFIFRKNISKKIDDMTSISKEGANFNPNQTANKVEKDSQKDAKELLKGLDSKLLIEQESIIQNELSQRNLKDEEIIEILAKYLAATQIALAFEVVYNLIWGSQINALEGLNSQIGGESRERIKIYYNEAAKKYSSVYDSYTFEKWLNFLKNGHLLLEENNVIKITVKGREFLLYLTRNGLSKKIAG